MDINIPDYLGKENIVLELKHKSKKNILSFLLDNFVQVKQIRKEDKKKILKIILQREDMGSTAIGGHIALPHARVDCVKDVKMCLAVSPEGVDFDSLDQELVHVIVLLLSNQKEAGIHLKMLAFLARMLRDKYFIQQLKNARTVDEVIILVEKQQQAVR